MPTYSEVLEQANRDLFTSLATTSISQNVSRIDSDACNPHPHLFNEDKIEMRVGNKTAFIREAQTCEFDWTPSGYTSDASYPERVLQSIPPRPTGIIFKLKKKVPKLWLLITEIQPGLHCVLTLYRGSAPWKVREHSGRSIAIFKNDKELKRAIELCQLAEGMNLPEWVAFEAKYIQAAMDKAGITFTPIQLNDIKVN